MKDKECIFCKIADGKIPSHRVYENEEFLAFLDVSPAAPGHILLIPKEHYRDVEELPAEISAGMLSIAASLGKKTRECLGAEGFNLLFNTGRNAGQTVFHCHMHIIPRKPEDGALLLWEPARISQEELEKTAERLRKRSDS